MLARRLPVAEHPLQRQIADALRLEIASSGNVSRDGVVWWSVEVVHFYSVEEMRQREAELVSADDKPDAAYFASSETVDCRAVRAQ